MTRLAQFFTFAAILWGIVTPLPVIAGVFSASFPDAISCVALDGNTYIGFPQEELSGANGISYSFGVYGTNGGYAVSDGNIQYDGAGNFVAIGGSSPDLNGGDCDGTSLATLESNGKTYSFAGGSSGGGGSSSSSTGIASSTCSTVGSTTVCMSDSAGIASMDQAQTNLFYGFILYFVGMFGTLWLIRKR